MAQDNLNLYLALFAKYAPTVLKIIQTDGPVIGAFLVDLKAVQSGQAPSAVVPSTASLVGEYVARRDNLAAPKGPL